MYTKNYAPLDSPTFTGTPKAPTPATDASRTELVTAKWVNDKSYANTNYVYRFGFFDTKITTENAYSSTTNSQTITDFNGNLITFEYGIYMCTMKGNQNFRKVMTVEFVRLTQKAGAGSDDDSCKLNGAMNDGNVTLLHFRPNPSNDRQIQVWGNTGSNETLTIYIYRII